MGGDISTSFYKSSGIHQEHQNKLMKEYTYKCVNDPQIAIDDNARWESVKTTILFMDTLKEQAEYADYVTSKTFNFDNDIVVSIVKDMEKAMEWSLKNNKRMNACAIGNCAFLILGLDNYPQYSTLKSTFSKVFERVVNAMKNLNHTII